MDRYRIMTLVSLVFLSGLSPGLSSDLTTGKDRRTDGVALDFHSPPQHAGLFTGSATYSIPIDLPAAPGGHSPHLEIAYNSDRGNGWLGLGWDIAGLHRIERSTKYGVPSYMDPPSTEAFNTRHFDQFDLYLEGRHYEIFWDVNSKRYVTNPYAHFQITTKVSRKTVSQWTIVSKNGTKYVFEGIPAVGRPGFRFFPVASVIDRNGNLIKYRYCKDEENGDYYPLSVTYGQSVDSAPNEAAFSSLPSAGNPNSLPPRLALNDEPNPRRNSPQILVVIKFVKELRKVKVGYDLHNDPVEVIHNYKGGSRFEMDERISAISIHSSNSSEPIRTYDLDYMSTQYGHQSLLKEVRNGPLKHRFNYHGKDKSEQGFDQKANIAPNLWPMKSRRGNGGERFPGVRWVDLNGDSLADMVWGLKQGSGIYGRQAIADKPFSWTPLAMGSIDGGWMNKVSTAAQHFPAPISRYLMQPSWTYGYFDGTFAGTEVIDVNNDGFVDVLHSFKWIEADFVGVSNHQWRVTWINDKKGAWQQDPAWALPIDLAIYEDYTANSQVNAKIVDVNGDGFPDVVHAVLGTFLNKGRYGEKGWDKSPSPMWKTPISELSGLHSEFGFINKRVNADRTYHDLGVRYVDLNNDGLNDVVKYSNWSGSNSANAFVQKAWINTGASLDGGTVYQEASNLMPPVSRDDFQLGWTLTNAELGTQLFDINRDGFPDLLCSLKHDTEIDTRGVAFGTSHGFHLFVDSLSKYPSLAAKGIGELEWIESIPPFAVRRAVGTSSSYEDDGVSLADFNGDGALDIGRSRLNYANALRKDPTFKPTGRSSGIWLNKFKPPLLASVETPPGGKIVYEYSSSHGESNYAAHRDEDGVHRMPAPKQVITSIAIDDGVGNTVKSRFAYRGGRFDLASRDFRGFRTVEVTHGDATDKTSPPKRLVYQFHQDDAQRGQVASLRIGRDQVFSESTYQYVTESHGRDKNLLHAYETHPSSVVNLTYDSVDADRHLVLDLNFNATNRLSFDSWPCHIKIKETASGIKWTKQSISGYAAYFESPESAHRVRLNGVELSAVSVQFWMWPERLPASRRQTVLEAMDSFIVFLNENGMLCASIHDGTRWHELNSKYQVPTNAYTHVTFDYDGERTARICINGIAVIEDQGFRGPLKASRVLNISSGSRRRAYHGYLDDIKLFSAVVHQPKITRSNFAYDRYGNPSTVHIFGDLSKANDDVVRVTHYRYQADRHILDRPSYSYVRKAGPERPKNIIAATWHDYDELGNLTAVTKWAGSRHDGQQPKKQDVKNLVTTLSYDLRGNVTSIENPRGAKTTVKYNNRFRAFPESISNALGHTQHFEYYGLDSSNTEGAPRFGLFGQLKRTTNASGATSRLVYDALGRLRGAYLPGDGDIEKGHLFPSLLMSYQDVNVGGRTLRGIRTFVREQHVASDAHTERFEDADPSDLLYWSLFTDNYLQLPHILGSWALSDGLGRTLQTLGEANVKKGTASVGETSRYDGQGRVDAVYKPYFTTNPGLFEASPPDSDDYKYMAIQPEYLSPDQRHPKYVISYDQVGRPTRVTAPDGTFTMYKYDRWRTTVIDANKHRRDLHYNAYGRLIKIVEYQLKYGTESGDANREAVLNSEDAELLQPSSHVDLGRLADFDGLARELRGTTLRQSKFPIETRYEYDVLGNLTAIVDTEGNRTEFDYDVLGRRTHMRHPDMQGGKQAVSGGTMVQVPGRSWEYKYDRTGNLVDVRDPKGQRIGFEYDVLDRVVKKRHYNHAPWTAAHLGAGPNDESASRTGLWHTSDYRTSYFTNGSFAFNHEDTHSYEEDEVVQGDLVFGPIDLAEYATASVSISYYWDTRPSTVQPIDNMSVYISSNGHDWTLLWDDATLKKNHPARKWGKIRSGALDDSVLQAVWIKCVFDSVSIAKMSATKHEGWYVNEVKVEGLKKADVIEPTTWVYDDPSIGGKHATGRLVKMIDPSGSTEYEYDIDGNISQITKTIGQASYTTKFTHDALGRVKTMTYPASSGGTGEDVVEYVYGRNGYPKELRNAKGHQHVSDAEYDATGTLRQLKYGNGVLTKWEFDDDKNGDQLLSGMTIGHQWTGSLDSRPVTIMQPFVDVRYEHDAVGNLVLKDNRKHPQLTTRYDYDALNRLRSARTTTDTRKYTYDRLGNLTSLAGAALSYESAGGSGPHALTRLQRGGINPTDVRYKYDDNGNLSSTHTDDGGDTTLKYDYENRLLSVNDDVYTYDGNGLRVKKQEGTHTTVYPFPWCEVEDGHLVKYYMFAGSVVARSDDRNPEPNRILYLHEDHLGSVHLVSNEKGKIVDHIEYFPFGSTRTKNETVPHGSRAFTGKQYDASGLYYFGARYYDNESGRFITPDPLDAHTPEFVVGSSQRLNLFSYALNSPTTLVDRLGLAPSYPKVWRVTFVEDEIVEVPVSRITMPDHVITIPTSLPPDPGTKPLPMEERGDPSAFGPTWKLPYISSPRRGYSYVREQKLGSMGHGMSAKGAMSILQRNPACCFPFKVASPHGRSIVNGRVFDLQGARTYWLGLTSIDSGNLVTVESVTPTSFTFRSLPGHFAGNDATIKFTTFERGGSVYLRHTGTAPNAGPLNRIMAPLGARNAWRYMADMLRIHYLWQIVSR